MHGIRRTMDKSNALNDSSRTRYELKATTATYTPLEPSRSHGCASLVKDREQAEIRCVGVMIAMPERCSQSKAARRWENPHRLRCSGVVVHVFSKLICHSPIKCSIRRILMSQDQRYIAYRARVFADGE